MLLIAFGLQVVAGTPQPDTVAVFDLRDLKPAPARCDARRSGEIVVCGRNRSERLQRLPASERGALPKARIGVGKGGSLSAEASARALDRGAVSQRAMVTLRMAF